jgi:iron complex outermembrane receptor protein
VAALPARGEEPVRGSGDAHVPPAEQPGAAPDARARQADAVPGATEQHPADPAGPSEPPELLPDGLEEIVIVGRRPRGEVARDPTASATVIEAERFAGEAKGVAELVATAPGVAVSEYGGLGQLSTVSIRGSTASGVLVLLDGLPLNTAAGGGVDLSTIPRPWISRIEVARGAEGAHFGVGALGGIVNVVTRRPDAGAWSAEASAGSFNTFSAAAESGTGGERWTLVGQASAEGTGGEFPYERARLENLDRLESGVRDNNGALRGGALAKLTAHRGARRLDALAQVTGGRRELAGWPTLTARDWQEDGRALAMVRLTTPGPSERLVLAGRAHLRADLLDLSIQALFAGRVMRQRGGAAGIAAETLWAHPGGDLRATASIDGEALQSSALGGTRSRAALSLAASEELSLASGRLRVAPAVRVDRVGPFDGVSGKLGASLGIAGPLALRASAGRSFRPPTFAELHLEQGLVMPNPDLRSEEGIGGDAGLVADGRLGFAAVGAHATLYRDLIQYEATAFGRLKPRNAGKALVTGLEAEAATAPVRALLGLALSTSYTLLLTENLRGSTAEVGNELPFRPRHRLYARAAVAPGPATAHVECHYVGAQHQDTRHVLPRIPAALVWNAGASIGVVRRPDVRLHLELKNVLDDRTLQEPLGGPLPGRMVMLTVRAGSSATKGSP